jgi:hypothetical protein
LVYERDERWAYVVLVLLVAAYIVYRFVPLSGPSELIDRLRGIELGRLGKMLPYLAAPLFAVLSEFLRRKKAGAVREAWERSSRAEGFVRGEEDLKVRFVEGGRGTIEGAVRLTRAALYMIDKGGRRDPLRFALTRSDTASPVVLDASLHEGRAPGLRRVRVAIGDADGNRFAIEFESREAVAWWSSLRRAIGKSTDISDALSPPTDEETRDAVSSER